MNSTFKFSFTKSDLDKIFWRFTSNDTRYEVKENSKMPYSAIGLLKIEYCNEVTSYRTGFLIADNVILTAGHNLYDARKNPKKPNEILGEPTKIEFYPGLNRNESSYNVTDKIKKIMFPSDFKTKPNEDYGIILLSEKIDNNIDNPDEPSKPSEIDHDKNNQPNNNTKPDEDKTIDDASLDSRIAFKNIARKVISKNGQCLTM